MSFTRALYYPWIDIQDERWLRSACLYWERLHTIVPASIRRPYKTQVSQELFDAGVLEPVRVEPGIPEIKALAPEVISFLESPEGTQLLRESSKGERERIHLDKLPFEMAHLTRIHPDKLPYEIVNLLSPSAQRVGWLQVDPTFADFYMTLLANRISEQRGIGLLTSSLAADRLANTARSGARVPPKLSRGHHGDSTSSKLVEGIVADLVLTGFSIAPDISIKKILSFRKQHSTELAHFRAKVGELAKSIPTDATPEAIRQHANDVVNNEVKPAVADLRAALRGSKIKAFTDGLLKISALSAGPASILVAPGFGLPTALAVGTGVSLVATTVLMAVGKKEILRQNPFSYLFSLQKKFA